jgi:TolA-binding protein
MIFLGLALALMPAALDAQEPEAVTGDESGKTVREEGIDIRRFADDTKFQNAMQFFLLKDYDRAMGEFKEYLEIYLRGAHRVEAWRGIAKIYFDRYEYERSARAYNAIYEESTSSEEGIDAFYRTGLCYQKMGDDAKAQSIFAEIVQKYPYANCRQLAQVQLDVIKIISK